MSQQAITYNAQAAQRAVGTINELVSNMMAATLKYKSILESAASKSNLSWISNIVKEAGVLGESAQKLTATMGEVQTALTQYNNQVNTYDTDVTGL